YFYEVIQLDDKPLLKPVKSECNLSPKNNQNSATKQGKNPQDIPREGSPDYEIIKYLTHPNLKEYPAQVARRFGKHRSTILRKAEKFVEQEFIFRINPKGKGIINVYEANPVLFPEFSFPLRHELGVKVHNFHVRLDPITKSMENFLKARKKILQTTGRKKKGMNWIPGEITDDMLGHWGRKKFKEHKFRISVTTKCFHFYIPGFGEAADEAEYDAEKNARTLKEFLERKYDLCLKLTVTSREHHFTPEPLRICKSSHPGNIEGTGPEGGKLVTQIVEGMNKIPKLELDLLKTKSRQEKGITKVVARLDDVNKAQEKTTEAIEQMSNNIEKLVNALGIKTGDQVSRVDERIIPSGMFL
ncbi:MAG: hypothetical protein ACTSUE_01375, partial [Promethearchaeota archaeon]